MADGCSRLSGILNNIFLHNYDRENDSLFANDGSLELHLSVLPINLTDGFDVDRTKIKIG